jgi:uncharacterized protein (TIGR03000 family)
MRSFILSAVVGVTAFGLPATAARAGEAPATLRVLLPTDAVLTIDGAPTQATSAVRSFVTPPLPAGRDFRYDLRAQLVRDGKSVTVERRVTVRAGQETVTELRPPVAPSAGVRLSAPVVPLVDVGGARDNWKPDSSDPFYPWD